MTKWKVCTLARDCRTARCRAPLLARAPRWSRREPQWTRATSSFLSPEQCRWRSQRWRPRRSVDFFPQLEALSDYGLGLAFFKPLRFSPPYSWLSLIESEKDNVNFWPSFIWPTYCFIHCSFPWEIFFFRQLKIVAIDSRNKTYAIKSIARCRSWESQI